MNDIGAHVGKIYAQALFELAAASRMVDAVKYNLDTVAAVSSEVNDLEKLIVSPYFSTEYKGGLVCKAFAGKLPDLTMDFLMVVIRHNRLAFLPQMISGYNALWRAYHAYCPVKVTVARPMSDDEVQKLSEDIAASMNRKIKLELAINPSIMGGIIIHYDDKVIDNSVRSRLERTVKAITNQRIRRGKNDEI